MKKQGSVLGGVLLIGGTCIGAGMLGLPVMTAAAGFYPTMAAFLIVWFFMSMSAFAYLEVTLRYKGDVNFISVVGHTLGPYAKFIAWICYVMLLFSLMAAYTAGGTTIFTNVLGLTVSNPREIAIISIVFVLPFAFIVYLGTSAVDHINRLLMLGLIATFAMLCAVFMMNKHENHFYAFGNPQYLWFTLPLLVTSFGYHTIIPTLKTYLNEDIKKLRLTILIGGLSPLVIYGVWELMILYLIPTWGDNGLVSMFRHEAGNPADSMAQAISVHGGYTHSIITWFSYFALTSSFIGVGIGIRDFLSDGLRIKKTHMGRLWLSILTFVPPFLYTMFYPGGFLFALKYAGILAAVLLIVFPAVMAWRVRYGERGVAGGKYHLWGGKALLVLTLLFGVLVMCTDVLLRMGLLPQP